MPSYRPKLGDKSHIGIRLLLPDYMEDKRE